MSEEKIRQIIPAEGWRAAYLEDGVITEYPLICFALVICRSEGDDGEELYRTVIPMGQSEGRDASFCKEDSNFLGTLGPGQEKSLYEAEAAKMIAKG